ncbi:hypothetical protein ACHAXH_004422 [Discostella pseudostelligera]|jgi:hypothetical protein
MAGKYEFVDFVRGVNSNILGFGKDSLFAELEKSDMDTTWTQIHRSFGFLPSEQRTPRTPTSNSNSNPPQITSQTMTAVEDSPSRKSSGLHYGATSTTTSSSTIIAPTNVQVIAPATLSAGYVFEAMYENIIFDVTVPEGGVTKGQRFIVPFVPPPPPPPAAVATAILGEDGDMITSATVAAIPSMEDASSRSNNIPMGKWRDNLFDCFHYGFFHPALWCACLFKPCLLGQLLTRMKMSWLGHRYHRFEAGGGASSLDDSRIELDERWRYTFRNVVVVTAIFFVVTSFLSSMEEEDVITPPMEEGEDFDEYIQRVVADAIQANDEDDTTSKETLASSIDSFLSFAYGTYITYVMIQLRATMRHVYAIPEQFCKCWYALFGTNQRQRLDGGTDEGNVCGNCGYISERCCTADVPVGWEDICCAFWCQCCVLGQMARHTVNYDERNALCCNEVGVANWNEDEAYDGVDKKSGGVRRRVVGEGSVLIV